MPLSTCSMQFEGVTKANGTGGVTPVKLHGISYCGLLLVASDQSDSRYSPFRQFRRKSFVRFSGSMTGSRDSHYQRNTKSYGLTVTTNIRLKLMKSEAIEEEDTTADPAVCEH